MVLDVLQCRLRDQFVICRLLLRVAEQSELQAEIGKASPISTRDAACGAKSAVLPGAVRIGGAQYALGILQLFRHLDEVERLSGPPSKRRHAGSACASLDFTN